MNFLIKVRAYDYTELMSTWPNIDTRKNPQGLPNGHFLIRTGTMSWMEYDADRSVKGRIALCLTFPHYFWLKLTRSRTNQSK
jgi:hypothetical protein